MVEFYARAIQLRVKSNWAKLTLRLERQPCRLRGEAEADRYGLP